jgi:hypothetical protein
MGRLLPEFLARTFEKFHLVVSINYFFDRAQAYVLFQVITENIRFHYPDINLTRKENTRNDFQKFYVEHIFPSYKGKVR